MVIVVPVLLDIRPTAPVVIDWALAAGNLALSEGPFLLPPWHFGLKFTRIMPAVGARWRLVQDFSDTCGSAVTRFHETRVIPMRRYRASE